MYLKYALIADSVTADAGGKLTVVGIFDLILAPKFPTVHRDMNLVLVIEGTPSEKGEHKLTVELRDEKGNKILGVDREFLMMPGKAVKNKLSTQLLFKFQDLRIQNPGQYEFVLFVNDRFLGRTTLAAQKVNVEEAGER